MLHFKFEIQRDAFKGKGIVLRTFIKDTSLPDELAETFTDCGSLLLRNHEYAALKVILEAGREDPMEDVTLEFTDLRP